MMPMPVIGQFPANGFLARFPGTRVVSDVGRLVTADDVDVVDIATPHHRHAPDNLLALRSGKPVLCETPFATSAAEALTIVEEARVLDLFCMEAMWMRCDSVVGLSVNAPTGVDEQVGAVLRFP